MASRIVGLSGPAGSGKSEAAAYLVNHFGYTPVKFAGPLKDMLRAYLRSVGLDEIEIERRIEGDLKETPDAYLNGRTPRHAMETLGTEWGRVCMGDDFWIKAWARTVENIPAHVVTDDCRFDNEAEAIRDSGGEVMRLRPNVQRRKKSKHVAEAGIRDDLVDHGVVNDGTVQDLRVKVADALYPNALFTLGTLE